MERGFTDPSDAIAALNLEFSKRQHEGTKEDGNVLNLLTQFSVSLGTSCFKMFKGLVSDFFLFIFYFYLFFFFCESLFLYAIKGHMGYTYIQSNPFLTRRFIKKPF